MPDKLGEFLTACNWKLLRTIKGWQVERDDVATDVVRLSLSASDGECYIVRFVCDGYPDLAPRVVFIDAAGSTSERTAWPDGDVTFYQVVKLPPNSFLCTDLTREGLAHHPDWANLGSAWNGQKHTLMHLFNYIQDEILNSPHYKGRAT
jgi:hypothetical protein